MFASQIFHPSDFYTTQQKDRQFLHLSAVNAALVFWERGFLGVIHANFRTLSGLEALRIQIRDIQFSAVYNTPQTYITDCDIQILTKRNKVVLVGDFKTSCSIHDITSGKNIDINKYKYVQQLMLRP